MFSEIPGVDAESWYTLKATVRRRVTLCFQCLGCTGMACHINANVNRKDLAAPHGFRLSLHSTGGAAAG